MMESKEKARELYDKFQCYYWHEKDGFMPDDKETKKVCKAIVDEIISACEYNNVEVWNTDWWNKVKEKIDKI